MSTENRRPHTVYLSDEVWNALERQHLQLRLEATTPLSKIDFIEQVLRAGLAAVGAPSTTLSTPAPVPTDGLPAPAPNHTPEVDQPRQEQRRGRRTSAIDRLREASEPGRPAPIRSAADAEDTTTS